MKTRIQFEKNGKGIDNAVEYREKHGGLVAKQHEEHFDSQWLKAVYHYSFEHTRSEIFADLPGYVEIVGEV